MSDYSEKLRAELTEDLAGLPEDAPVFGTKVWLEATRKALPFPLKILKVYKGDSFAAYLPLHEVSKGGLSKAFAPIFTFYGGPYYTGEARKYFNEEIKQRYEILAAALGWLEKHYHYALLLPDDADARPALERGWICSPRYTLVNRLGSEHSLEFNRACAKNIRKAERAGLTFAQSNGGADFSKAFARTFARKGLSMSWKPEWADAMRKALSGSGILDNCSVFTPEGKEIAFASVALDRPRKTAILWYSCSLEEADHSGAMHFLYQQLLVRYTGEFATFDLCGADHRSLSEFKEKFAQELVVRFALEKYRGPVAKGLMKAYAALRNG